MPAHTGPSLPKSLLEELSGQDDSSHKRRSKTGSRQLHRKEARKLDRQKRKQRKAEFFTSGPAKASLTGTKRNAVEEHPESPQRKKAKQAQPVSSVTSAPTRSQAKPPQLKSSPKEGGNVKKKSAEAEKGSRKAKGIFSRRKSPTMSAPAAIYRSRQEEEEDAYIAYLESKLGLNKQGKRTANHGKGDDDGLDDFLQDLEVMEKSVFSHRETNNADMPEPDSEEDQGRRDNLSDDEDEWDSVEDEEEEDGEWSGIQESDKQGGVAGGRMPESHSEPESAAPVATETASRYVPPHLRNREKHTSQGDSETQLKLTKQFKGLLNRMSEQNIASIIEGVEEIYRNHRRHDVTSTLSSLIIDGIASHSMLLDSYVVLHAALISALHKLIGVEFAAYFVQNTIATYERHSAELLNGQDGAPTSGETDGLVEPEVETFGKECSNLIVLISELYNFQVISCVLVYDIIRGLLDGDLMEFKVELLLKIMRNSGPQLRLDDPTALKSIIEIVHSKIPSDTNAMSSRTRFMVETLTNLKNNKLRKNSASVAGIEAVERLQKFLTGLSKKRHVLAHEPLRVSLEDLHSAESKGKWWLVGAAWGGDPLVEHQQSQREAEGDALNENVLLKLARKQGMNTEIRRGIFVVLMSSEDYVDACERLSQLKLTEVQQREIVRVILHCCGNEKTYNPFYTLVGQQLCRTSHSHKITLQFCLWDFLRDLGETTVGGAEIVKNLGEDAGFNMKNISSTRIKNVARAYGWWIARDCCTLAIMKPIDFTILQPQSQAFLKELFIQVFVSTQASTPLLSTDPKDLPKTRNRGPLEEVFIKTTRLQALVIGLVYFLGEAFREEGENGGFLKWASQVARDTLRTGIDVAVGL